MTEIKYGGTIGHIIEMLKKYTLENYSMFNINPHYLTKESEEKYKGCISICGNFVEYSNAFSITTDDKELINELKPYFSGKIKGATK